VLALDGERTEAAIHRRVPSEEVHMSLKVLEPRHLAIPAAVVAMGLVIAYLTGNLPEWIAGSLFGGLIILIAAGLVVRRLVPHDATNPRALAALCLGAIVAVSAAASLFSALIPRDPIFDGILHQGEPLELPPEAHGSMRLALHARLPGNGPANADLTVAVGEQRLESRVSRRIVTARAGRRGRTEHVRDETTSWHTANIPDDARSIQLVEVTGSIQGGVRVQVFDDFAPMRIDLPVALFLLLSVAWMAGRGGEGRTSVLAAGLALGFGLAAHELVAPDEAVRRELGALISGGLVGCLAGRLIATPFERRRARSSSLPRTDPAEDLPPTREPGRDGGGRSRP
jgi:hypothetical protein